jgi:hypothetical protein
LQGPDAEPDVAEGLDAPDTGRPGHRLHQVPLLRLSSWLPPQVLSIVYWLKFTVNVRLLPHIALICDKVNNLRFSINLAGMRTHYLSREEAFTEFLEGRQDAEIIQKSK